ncbi:hypothetical protein SEA_BIG4_56 [Microbacterium phage Big4]|nr:hypothetical protein SEA_BIG4_56 [Microbacterium phage Big4]
MAPITWEDLSEESRVMFLLTPGTRLYGYCNGYFGRDGYMDKTVMHSGHINGVPWVLAVMDGDTYPMVAHGFTSENVMEWRKPGIEEDDDFPQY